MFIVFEGVDRVGKTTAIENVAKELNGCGRLVTIIKESDDPMMQYIKQSKLDINTIFYLVNKMREEHQHLIRRILDTGSILLFDRYYDSTYVYAHDAVVGNEYCENIIFDHIAPDLTMYLYADPKLIVERIADERDRFTSNSLERVQTYLDRFDELYNKVTTRDIYDFDVTDMSIPEVSTDIFKQIAHTLRHSGQ